MRLKNNPNAIFTLKTNKRYIINDVTLIKKNQIFKNSNNLNIEIGMGKGKFITDMSINNLNENYIGIDKFDTVLAIALKRIENRNIKNENIKFVNLDASNLLDDFRKNSISKIFINFPDPWPKTRHKKRRVVYGEFLKIYYSLLKKNGTLEFKTDQKFLFEFLISEIEKINIFNDLKTEDNLHLNKTDIITTEHEEKFIKRNKKIYWVSIKK